MFGRKQAQNGVVKSHLCNIRTTSGSRPQEAVADGTLPSYVAKSLHSTPAQVWGSYGSIQTEKIQRTSLTLRIDIDEVHEAPLGIPASRDIEDRHRCGSSRQLSAIQNHRQRRLGKRSAVIKNTYLSARDDKSAGDVNHFITSDRITAMGSSSFFETNKE